MSTNNSLLWPFGLQLQDQGQSQDQGELQGQLQGQGELQGQDQGQDQGQGQGQDQGQSQGQEQYVAQEAYQESLNGNGNLNGNLNINAAENSLSNTLDNAVNNNVNVNVNVAANVSAETPTPEALPAPADNDFIDLDGIDLGGLTGSVLLSTDDVAQTVTNGNNFNLDQINSLVDNDHIGSASVSYGGEGGGEYSLFGGGGGFGHSDPGFAMNATVNGGANSANGGTATFDEGDAGGVGSAANSTSLNQEAFTQHIVMGANIQYNSMDLTVNHGDVGDGLAGS